MCEHALTEWCGTGCLSCRMIRNLSPERYDTFLLCRCFHWIDTRSPANTHTVTRDSIKLLVTERNLQKLAHPNPKKHARAPLRCLPLAARAPPRHAPSHMAPPGVHPPPPRLCPGQRGRRLPACSLTRVAAVRSRLGARVAIDHSRNRNRIPSPPTRPAPPSPFPQPTWTCKRPPRWTRGCWTR